MKLIIVFDEVPHEGHCPSAFVEVFRGSSVVISEVDKGSCREREREREKFCTRRRERLSGIVRE